jgi:lipopolysaccharide export system protein LptC
MNDTRYRAWRIRMTLIISLCLAAALASFWLLQMMQKQNDSKTQLPNRGAPDYIIENFNFVRTSKTGQASYLLSGVALVHHPLDNSADIRRPTAKSFKPNKATVTVTSEHGKIFDDKQHIQLRGKVNINRPATAQAEALHMETESLLIATENDTMQTDDPVKMTIGNTVLRSTGMVVDQNKGEIRLLHQVRGHIAPKPKQ